MGTKMKKLRIIKRHGFYENVQDNIINNLYMYLPDDTYEIIITVEREDKTWSHDFDPSYFDISFFTEDVHYQQDFLIPHGIADKNWRDKDRVNMFNYVGVSGPKWVDKLVAQGMSPDRIRIIGYPKLDHLFDKRYFYLRGNKNVINVLYAPTHNLYPENKLSVSSYPRLVPYIDKLPENIQITHSLHPANNSKKITFHELLYTDVVISDSGSLIYEAWALGIPVIFPSWLVKKNTLNAFPNSFEDEIYTKRIGYHVEDANKLESIIVKACERGIDSKTEDFIEGIFPEYLRGVSGRVLADELIKFTL